MKVHGFTLVELLITVAIVAILATIAYPSYLEFMQKARRADAHSALTALQLAQEQVRGNCRFYAGGIDPNVACPSGGSCSFVCEDPASSSDVVLKKSTTSKDGYYTLSITAASGNSYTIQAAPTAGGAQEGDTDCATITLTVDTDHPNGDRGGTSGIACWE